MEDVCGLQNDEPLVQPLGEVGTPEGQSIAFPNVYQQRRSSLCLVDPTRPGHRSFMAFYLVDPTQRVLSTARVPPQQAEWMEEGLAEAMADSVPVKALQALIMEYVGWPMTEQEAQRHRRAMAKQRRAMLTEYTAQVFETFFDPWPENW